MIVIFIPEFQQMQIWPQQALDNDTYKFLYEISVGADDIQQLGKKQTEQCNLKKGNACFGNLDLSGLTIFPSVVHLNFFGGILL